MTKERQRKTKDPCHDCGLHRDRCICHLIPSIHTRTRVCLVIHRKELKRTTNTGQLALKSLVNSEMRVRGEQNQTPLDLRDLLTTGYRSLLFFPSSDAVELTREFVEESSCPVQLIVPDGNWRQASKVHSRHLELKGVPKVKIATPNLSTTHLRAEHFAEGMSTLEAIACALGVIEGPQVMAPLLKLYAEKLNQTLIGRGVR